MYVSLFLFLDYIMLVYKRQHPSFFFSVLYNFLYLFCLLFTIYAGFSAGSTFSPVVYKWVFPGRFSLFHLLAPRSAHLKFYRDFLPKSVRIPSTVLLFFHPALRNSVPVFSRSYVYICKVHVPGSGKIDCNLFQWDLY